MRYFALMDTKKGKQKSRIAKSKLKRTQSPKSIREFRFDLFFLAAASTNNNSDIDVNYLIAHVLHGPMYNVHKTWFNVVEWSERKKKCIQSTIKNQIEIFGKNAKYCDEPYKQHFFNTKKKK